MNPLKLPHDLVVVELVEPAIPILTNQRMMKVRQAQSVRFVTCRYDSYSSLLLAPGVAAAE